MNAKRTDPRVHCWARPMTGAYVPAASTTPAHLAAVFAAERARPDPGAVAVGGLNPMNPMNTNPNERKQPMNVRPLKSYRAHLVPQGVDASRVEDLADAGLLPSIRVKAASSTQAEAYAHITTGQQVLRVERVEPVEG